MAKPIRFINDIKLSPFAADEKYNERRIRLAPRIAELIASNPLFGEGEITVEYAHTCVSSLVCFVEAASGSYVLKTSLSLSDGGDSEALFLRQWEAAGIPVPHVYESGRIGDHAYTLMARVDAPTLERAMEDGSARPEAHVEMGGLLARMHAVCSEGFGRIVNGKPQHRTFKDWLLSEDIAKRIAYVQEYDLLTNEHGRIDRVFDALIAHAETNRQSSYCHFDFSAPNVLATDPLTVFDPSPMLNIGVIDLGRSVLSTVFQEKPALGEQLKEGYFSGNAPYDAQALQAAIILNAHWKLPYQHKKGLTRKIEVVRDYLAEHQNLL